MAKQNQSKGQVRDFTESVEEQERLAEQAASGGPGPEFDGPPAGWESANDPDIDGWLQLDEPGATVLGVIKGHKVIEDDTRDMRIVLVELQKPCKAMVGSKGEYELSELPKGKVGAMYIKAKTESLWEYDKGTPIWVQAKEKVSIGKGKTMWQISCYVKPGSKKRVQPVTQRAAEGDDAPSF